MCSPMPDDFYPLTPEQELDLVQRELTDLKKVLWIVLASTYPRGYYITDEAFTNFRYGDLVHTYDVLRCATFIKAAPALPETPKELDE